MIIKRRSKVDILVFVIFTLLVVNIASIHVFFEETKRKTKNDIEFFIKSKQTAMSVNYNYILRETQKMNDMASKLSSMKYYNNIYYYVVYVKRDDRYIFLEKSNDEINDKLIIDIIEYNRPIIFHNYRYFIPYNIKLNSKYNQYVKHRYVQGIIVLEELPLEVMFPIKENKLNFRDTKLTFTISIDNVNIELFLNTLQFLKIHSYKFFLFNILCLFFDVIIILSTYRILKNTDKIIKTSMDNAATEIDKISKFITDKSHLFHTYQIHNISNLTKNEDINDSNITRALDDFNLAMHKSLLNIREETISKSRNILKESKSSLRNDVEKAFKMNVPDLDFEIPISNYTMDVYSHATPATLTEADGVFFHRKDNKAFFIVYDVSGHDMNASYKSIIVYNMISMGISKLKSLNMKDAIRAIWEETSYLKSSTVDAALFCIDFDERKIEISFFGTMFFVYFDNDMCVSAQMCVNNISQLQHAKNRQDYIEKALINFKSNNIPFDGISRMVVLTDGYTDAFKKDGNMLGDIELRKLLHTHDYKKKSKTFTHNVMKDFENLISDITDDRTILTVTLNNKEGKYED